MSALPQPDPQQWSDATVADLRAAGLDPAGVAAVLASALAEDFVDGPDVTTSATVPADARGSGAVVPRQDGVLCGGAVAAAVFETVAGADPVTVRILVADGGRATAGEPVLELTGTLGALLSAERTALNLIGHLSGVATATRQWVDAVAGTGARIRDTRKTLPGLRALEKYAVRCGGGVNHRMSLGDAVLIKDNHVAAAGSVTAAIEAVRAQRPDLGMEVEVDDLAQFDQGVGRRAGADPAGQLRPGRHRRGGPPPRPPGRRRARDPVGGIRRAEPGSGRRGGRHRRGLPGRGRAHPLGTRPRPRTGPVCGAGDRAVVGPITGRARRGRPSL